ncbi:MAG: TRAP transporter TatT component family protein [Woeseiaceae bacterium]|nr:TRAP transporter TatT component family protein [Woeseiaceae bacterium]
MKPEKFQSLVKSAALLAAASLAAGCASLVSNAASGFADNLAAAVLNQDDPETARAAIPSYMILIDSMIEGYPGDPAMLSAGATLYASYGAVFADEPERARRLTAKARRYGLQAMCEVYADACGWRDMTYDDFVASLVDVPAKHAETLYTYGTATLAYLRAHSDDWNSLAELPQIEALFEHYLAIAGDDVTAATHTYMGILLTLRPPALGGKPEEARAHFERAIELSDGRDLTAKVEFARGYAKLLYERDLHDRLLMEVLSADPYADGLTLANVLAKQDAAALLAEADDYF